LRAEEAERETALQELQELVVEQEDIDLPLLENFLEALRQESKLYLWHQFRSTQ
jgi:hypothetical protein